MVLSVWSDARSLVGDSQGRRVVRDVWRCVAAVLSAGSVAPGPARFARLADQPPRPPEAVNSPSGAATEEIGAFEPFVRRFERQILNYLWRMTGDEQAAYDLTQEVFVRAWQHYETISHYEQPRGWLFRVATNLALTHNTARQRRSATSLAEAGPLFEGAPGTSDVARRIVERDLVRAVLLQLPPKRRAVLVLREVYGFSTVEVGAALGMAEPAVRMALSRAREQFRDLYQREEGRS